MFYKTDKTEPLLGSVCTIILEKKFLDYFISDKILSSKTTNCFINEIWPIIRQEHLFTVVINANLKTNTVRPLIKVLAATIIKSGNTKGGSITVPLTSCLTDFD
jgi:hypothetical protein